MPNHVTNIIKVTGAEDQIKQFFNENKDFSFNNFIPSEKTVDDHRANWGTKWDAYEVRQGGNKIIFDTAWSHPDPVIKEMSNMYPELTFDVKYADEDLGSNLGYYSIHDGVKFEENIDLDEHLFAISVNDNDGEEIRPMDFLRIFKIYSYVNGDDPVKSLDHLEYVPNLLINHIGLEEVYNLGDEELNRFLVNPIDEMLISKKLSIFIDKVKSNG